MAQTEALVGRNLSALNLALNRGLISAQDFSYIEKLLAIGSESSLKAAQLKLAALGISEGQINAYDKILKLEGEMRVALMSRFDQERDKAEQNFQKRMAEIAVEADASKMAADERAAAEQLARDELKNKSDAITAAQQAAGKAAVIKAIDDELFFHEQRLADGIKMSANDVFNFRVDKMRSAAKEGIVSEEALTEFVIEAERKRVAGVKEETQALEEKNKAALRDLELQQEIARSQTQAQLKAIRDNPFLNNYEKGQASIAPLQTQISQNDRAMSNLADTANQPGTDATAKFEAMQKINQLMSEQVDLQHQLSEAENADSFSYQLGQTIVRLQNVGTMAQQAAQAFGAVWTTAVNSISSSISGLIMGTQSWGQALRSIYNSITTEFVNQIVHMAVQWIMQHTIMAAFSSLFHVGEAAKAAASQATIVTITGTGAAQRIVIRTGEAAHDAAMTGVQVGTHAAGEGTKTGSTLLGAMARGVIRLGETIFHGLQVMIRVAAHFVGEMMMTAIAAVGMAARIPMILAETMAYVIMAAVEALAAIAAIPYVGPFLAPAIAAGILAAGIGLMTGGFAEGGYTGDGGKHDVAGIVHAGEYVMPASAVDRIGVENLAALHHGSTSATSPAPGGGGHGVQVYNFTDMNQMQQHLEKNPATEKHIVDVMRRNIHKFR